MSRSPTDSSALAYTSLFVAAGKFSGSCNKLLLQVACGKYCGTCNTALRRYITGLWVICGRGCREKPTDDALRLRTFWQHGHDMLTGQRHALEGNRHPTVERQLRLRQPLRQPRHTAGHASE
jgi:hypothetical protein